MTEDTREDVRTVLSYRYATCEPGQALQKVLRWLVEANLQEADEDVDTEEDKDRKVEAEIALFSLATEMTHGCRRVPE